MPRVPSPWTPLFESPGSMPPGGATRRLIGHYRPDHISYHKLVTQEWSFSRLLDANCCIRSIATASPERNQEPATCPSSTISDVPRPKASPLASGETVRGGRLRPGLEARRCLPRRRTETARRPEGGKASRLDHRNDDNHEHGQTHDEHRQAQCGCLDGRKRLAITRLQRMDNRHNRHGRDSP